MAWNWAFSLLLLSSLSCSSDMDSEFIWLSRVTSPQLAGLYFLASPVSTSLSLGFKPIKRPVQDWQG